MFPVIHVETIEMIPYFRESMSATIELSFVKKGLVYLKLVYF